MVRYEPGTVFSFSLTTVEIPADGHIEDAHVEIDGSGVEVLGFALSPAGVPDFDVAAQFPPTRRNLRGSTSVDSASVQAGAEGVRLMVGLRVVSGTYTEVHDITYTLVSEDGERRTFSSPVGLGQCFEDEPGVRKCPKPWPKGAPSPPS